MSRCPRRSRVRVRLHEGGLGREAIRCSAAPAPRGPRESPLAQILRCRDSGRVRSPPIRGSGSRKLSQELPRFDSRTALTMAPTVVGLDSAHLSVEPAGANARLATSALSVDRGGEPWLFA